MLRDCIIIKFLIYYVKLILSLIITLQFENKGDIKENEKTSSVQERDEKKMGTVVGKQNFPVNLFKIRER